MEPLSEVIPDAWFARPGLRVAPGLVGAQLCCRTLPTGQTTRWKIVEVEAYSLAELKNLLLGKRVGAQKAQRPSSGDGNASSGHGPGMAHFLCRGPHVYFAVTAGQCDAVLIRALEPEFPCDVRRLREASGPSRVTRALGLRGAQEGRELRPENGLWIEFSVDKPARSQVVRAERIGRASGAQHKLRWFLKSSLSVSQFT